MRLRRSSDLLELHVRGAFLVIVIGVLPVREHGLRDDGEALREGRGRVGDPPRFVGEDIGLAVLSGQGGLGWDWDSGRGKDPGEERGRTYLCRVLAQHDVRGEHVLDGGFRGDLEDLLWLETVSKVDEHTYMYTPYDGC